MKCKATDIIIAKINQGFPASPTWNNEASSLNALTAFNISMITRVDSDNVDGIVLAFTIIINY